MSKHCNILSYTSQFLLNDKNKNACILVVSSSMSDMKIMREKIAERAAVGRHVSIARNHLHNTENNARAFFSPLFKATPQDNDDTLICSLHGLNINTAIMIEETFALALKHNKINDILLSIRSEVKINEPTLIVL